MYLVFNRRGDLQRPKRSHLHLINNLIIRPLSGVLKCFHFKLCLMKD